KAPPGSRQLLRRDLDLYSFGRALRRRVRCRRTTDPFAGRRISGTGPSKRKESPGLLCRRAISATSLRSRGTGFEWCVKYEGTRLLVSSRAALKDRRSKRQQ